MFKNLKKNNTQEDILYNNILSLSRNKILYTTFNLTDTFQNRVYLIFMHISFGPEKKSLKMLIEVEWNALMQQNNCIIA